MKMCIYWVVFCQQDDSTECTPILGPFCNYDDALEEKRLHTTGWILDIKEQVIELS